MLDFDFYDIDGDGTEEIISCATDPYYTCYGIQILSRKGRHFEDVTNKFIPEELAYIKNMGQIIWIRMEECKDGTYLVGRLDSMDSIEQTKKLFKLENGSLVPFEKENPYTESFPIFTEWKKDYNYSESENADAHCQDNPYMGSYCIRLDNWYEFESQCFSLPKIDLTKFVENGYCLEFAMKNSDPLLELGLVFVDSKGEDHGYQITEDEKKSDGQWHIYTIPLNQFGKDDHYDYDIWKEINFFKAVVADYHGKEIYLDEIRIRKVVR